MTTHAILLAAGRGARMGERTRERPKCLTPLAGRPLLAWQLDALHTAGITDLHIVRGYRKELIAPPLTPPGCNLLTNDDWAVTNMVATLTCAEAVLQQHDCIVSYSDIVYHPEHIRRLAGMEADVAIAYDVDWASLWRLRFADPLADAESFRQHNGYLLEIGARATRIDQIEGQYMGLLRLTPRGWATIRDWLAGLPAERRARIDMTSSLRGLLDAGVPIACLPVRGRWCEVDSEVDAMRYEAALATGIWAHDWRS